VIVEDEVDPELQTLLVPAFIVQPIVENAIAHGMRGDAPLTVRLTGRACDDGSVRLTVYDDGVGIPALIVPHVLEPGFAKGLGIALKNVDDRLKGHFGPGSGVIVESVEGEGTAVSLVLARVAANG
jgi:two-component system sensor histidine kinase LytS